MARKASKAKSKKKVESKKAGNKVSKVKVPKRGTISFDYIKSYQFRVVHVDGAHGGIAQERSYYSNGSL